MEKRMETRTLVMAAVLTAITVLLQYMGSFVKLGPFSVSLVLIPIVIGAATCGVKVGAWLGFVFGGVVLLSGDAGAFLAVHAWGTVVTVLVKGTACGLLAGLAFKGMKKLTKNDLISTIVAAVVCPLVNTGVFLIGCLLFFMDTIAMWAAAANLGGGIAHYMIFGLVGANFIFELLFNIVLAPAVVHIIKVVNGR